MGANVINDLYGASRFIGAKSLDEAVRDSIRQATPYASNEEYDRRLREALNYLPDPNADVNGALITAIESAVIDRAADDLERALEEFRAQHHVRPVYALEILDDITWPTSISDPDDYDLSRWEMPRDYLPYPEAMASMSQTAIVRAFKAAIERARADARLRLKGN